MNLCIGPISVLYYHQMNVESRVKYLQITCTVQILCDADCYVHVNDDCRLLVSGALILPYFYDNLKNVEAMSTQKIMNAALLHAGSLYSWILLAHMAASLEEPVLILTQVLVQQILTHYMLYPPQPPSFQNKIFVNSLLKATHFHIK